MYLDFDALEGALRVGVHDLHELQWQQQHLRQGGVPEFNTRIDAPRVMNLADGELVADLDFHPYLFITSQMHLYIFITSQIDPYKSINSQIHPHIFLNDIFIT